MDRVDEAGDTGGILVNPDKYLSPLESSNKIDRKRGLELIQKQVSQLQPFDFEGNQVVPNLEIYTKIFQTVVICISDEMERCRELSFSILSILLKDIPGDLLVNFLPSIIPRLVERMGSPEIKEPSEEIRLIAVDFISFLVNLLGDRMSPFVDDLLYIMANTLHDPFHEVIKSSCSVTSQLAQTTAGVFHYNSERIVIPLARSIVHQQFRVRVGVIKCIGDVVQYGNHKLIEKLLPYLTQRLFDDVPLVRKQLAQVIGHWASNYIDRYSYFPKFLPFIMSGICDTQPDVSETAKELWKVAGRKFLEENKEEYRDQIDLPAPPLEYYPPNEIRPELGCRLLASKYAGRLFPGIEHEIVDWNPSTRLMDAQLLYMLILHGEDKITMHLDTILQTLFRATNDREMEINRLTLLSAELVGYFISISISWPMLNHAIRSSTSNGPLIIASHVIKSSTPASLGEYISDITDILDQEFCRTTRLERQESLLLICESLMRLVPKISTMREGYKVFYAIVSIHVLSSNGLSERTMGALKTLQEISGLNNLEELLSLHCGKMLKEMNEEEMDWNVTSCEKLMFEFILTSGGSAIETHMQLILSIMVRNLHPSKDSRVRLKFFTILGKVLAECSANSIKSEKKLFQAFVQNVIQEVLNPNLVWKAGGTACALRTAASSCLYNILQREILDANSLLEVAPSLVSTLLPLVNDQSELTRLFVAKSLGLIPQICSQRIPTDILHKIYPALLKRMDDTNNEVRKSACKSISSIFSHVPENYAQENKSYIEHVISTLLVHLDDQEWDIQSSVFDTLMAIGPMHKEFVIEACENSKSKHRSPQLCDSLINGIKRA